MDPPQQPQPLRHLPPLQSILPPHAPIGTPSRTANSTPISSPGLFSPTTNPRANMSFPAQPVSEGATPPAASHSPYLHPLQGRRVRETSRANVDRDFATGRKLINQYEVIEEIGRGQHGKVKLARNSENNEFVAIKIVPRLSKTRRLGKLSARDPQQNINREIAILKKIRHPNVVALLEVIDDSELRKIYMVLEHVERGEIVWRKKGLPHIFNFERHRLEKEMRGEEIGPNEEEWFLPPSVPHAAKAGSRTSSRVPSRNASAKSMSRAATPSLSDVHRPSSTLDMEGLALHDQGDIETPGPLRSNHSSSAVLEGTMYGAYTEDALLRARSPSMADSIISHMSSLDFDADHHYHDDYDYVPCFTIESARSTFRDTVLGLEYLHYQGVVHRDIKPANLLWTKEHRVKISDFGVSYFGRPIRDSESGETMSESEAHNFDDDRELSKTVGTPAFFAPELCYTDETKEPPRVSEQIDVWSLGVTLYCLIFARIPFIADDEFAMFRKIATEDVYIPRRRLRPVHPFTDPNKATMDRSSGQDPYRRDSDLAYEDVDDDLRDLLKAMLTKNPEQRIRLRDVKRHRWVLHGIDNFMGWLDDTDPSRKTSGRKIQVDERDIGRAVVPLTLLERARSTFKKAVGKVMGPRGDRSQSSSRRRATSSAASSSGEGSYHSPAHYYREGRRKSLRGSEDCFATVTQLPTSEHPLTQSVTASPAESPGAGVSDETKELSLWQSFKATTQRSGQHTHARSVTDAELSLGSPLRPSRTVPPTPAADGPTHDVLDEALRSGRSEISNAMANRARSMDRAGLVFPNADKRALPMVGISTAVAPGSVNYSRPQTPTGLGQIAKNDEPPSASASPRASVAYSNAQPKSDTNIYERRRFTVAERPSTSHQVEDASDAQQHLPRVYNSSTPESFARARQQQFDYLRQSHMIESGWAIPGTRITDPSSVPCPPSPDRGLSSRSVTDASDASARRDSRPDDDTPLEWQSHPSLPALMSGASSVSADTEGEFLRGPGVVNGRQPSLHVNTDPDQAIVAGKELKHQDNGVQIAGYNLVPLLDVNDPRNTAAAAEARSWDDDEDEDSDEGVLTMARRRRKSPPAPKEVSSLVGALGVGNPARRRDTNTSIASTETAKKVEIDGEQS